MTEKSDDKQKNLVYIYSAKGIYWKLEEGLRLCNYEKLAKKFCNLEKNAAGP